MTGEKLRLDLQDLTLRELSEVGEVLAPLSFEEALSPGPAQPRAMAAIAWVVRRREDPAFTYDQALDLRMGDLELVSPDSAEEGSPEPSGGGGKGAAPPPSLVSGASTPSG